MTSPHPAGVELKDGCTGGPERLYDEAVSVPTPEGAICGVRRGSGGPVLLLHGIPLSLLTWRRNLDALGRDHTVLAIDLLGYGRSQKPRASYGVADHARAVLAVLDRLSWPRVDLVGSSYGGAVALLVAAAQPPRIGKVVLINPVVHPGRRHSVERLIRIAALEPVMRTIFRRTGAGRGLLRRILTRSYADSRAAEPELADAYYRLLLRDNGERAFLATLRQLRPAEVAQTAGRVDHDTLIVWGAKDRVLPVGEARRLHRIMPRARLEILAHCGHLPHEEDPSAVNALIEEFLRPPLRATEHRVDIGQPVTA